MGSIDLDGLRALLLGAVLQRQSVRALFEQAYACLRLPMICFDVAFHTIAYAFPRPFYYIHWERIADEGRAPDDIVVAYNYLQNQEKMYAEGRSVYFDSGTCSGYPQACGPVMQDGQLVAYCGIMVEDADQAAVMAANDLLAPVIALLLREEERPGPAGGLERMAELVLLGNGVDGELSDRFRQAFRPPYVFAVLSAEGGGVSTMQYVRSLLCDEDSRVLGCLSGEKYICLLFYGLGGEQDASYVRASLAGVAEKYDLTGGVSDYFYDPAEVPGRRAQVMLAMSVARGERVASFRAHYADVIGYCALEFYGPAACRLPLIEKLALEEKTPDEYLRTLEAYLGAFRRCSAAAVQLGLHKNTMLNRIQKMEEILEEDLSDGGNAACIQTGLDMHRLLERFDGKGAGR